MKKFFVAVVLSVLFVAQSAFAMTFQQPVKIGGIGFPIQAPYHGYVVKGASQNDGKSYLETGKLISKPTTTYIKGIARFGDGEDALYCAYDFNAKNSNDHIKFGGKDNCTIPTAGIYQTISKIDTDQGITLYMMNYHSGTPHIDIIGRQKDGKWVSYIDTKKISDIYFGGNEAYKGYDGVSYSREPKFQGDTIIISYTCFAKSTKGSKIISQGEFRFTWDDAAQNFNVAQIVY